jgi:hypothetical protein
MQFIKKMKILYWMLRSACEGWYDEVWKRDLEELYCCSGDSVTSPCGCGGATVEDIYLNCKP